MSNADISQTGLSPIVGPTDNNSMFDSPNTSPQTNNGKIPTYSSYVNDHNADRHSTYILDGKVFNVEHYDGEDPESGEGKSDVVYNSPGGVYTGYYQYKYDNSPFKTYYTQQYDELVYADQDYDQMRLTLMWIDVSVEPWSLQLFNHDETIEYEPVESFPGTRVYLIDDVTAGDTFVFKFYWQNPGGIDIQQEENSDYEDYFINREG